MNTYTKIVLIKEANNKIIKLQDRKREIRKQYNDEKNTEFCDRLQRFHVFSN